LIIRIFRYALYRLYRSYICARKPEALSQHKPGKSQETQRRSSTRQREPDTSAIAPAREQSRRGVRGTPSSEGRQCLWLPEGGQPARLCERLAIRQRLRTPPLGNGPLVLSPITPLHTPTPGDSHPRQTASRRAGAESAGGPQRRSAEIADEKLPSSSRRWSSLAGSWSAQCRAATRGPRGARAFGRGQRRRGRGAGRRLPPPASRRAARSRSRQTGTP